MYVVLVIYIHTTNRPQIMSEAELYIDALKETKQRIFNVFKQYIKYKGISIKKPALHSDIINAITNNNEQEAINLISNNEIAWLQIENAIHSTPTRNMFDLYKLSMEQMVKFNSIRIHDDIREFTKNHNTEAINYILNLVNDPNINKKIWLETGMDNPEFWHVSSLLNSSLYAVNLMPKNQKRTDIIDFIFDKIKDTELEYKQNFNYKRLLEFPIQGEEDYINQKIAENKKNKSTPKV